VTFALFVIVNRASGRYNCLYSSRFNKHKKNLSLNYCEIFRDKSALSEGGVVISPTAIKRLLSLSNILLVISGTKFFVIT